MSACEEDYIADFLLTPISGELQLYQRLSFHGYGDRTELYYRQKQFHLYNRYYLLAASVISILVPFLNIPVYFSGADAKPVSQAGQAVSEV